MGRQHEPRHDPPVLITASDQGMLVDLIVGQRVAKRGWINVLPEIPEDVPIPPTPGPLAVFSKRGPVVPMATIMAPDERTTEQVGLQHGAASRVRDRLSALPGGCRVIQDNAKRGVVVAIAPDIAAATVATWVLDALAELCIPPRTARFAVYRFLG